jgi:hypothetical protein
MFRCAFGLPNCKREIKIVRLTENKYFSNNLFTISCSVEYEILDITNFGFQKLHPPPRKSGVCASDLFLSPMGNRISKWREEPIEGVMVPAGCFELAAQCRFCRGLFRPFTPPEPPFRWLSGLANGPASQARPVDPVLTLSPCASPCSLSFWMLKPDVPR